MEIAIQYPQKIKIAKKNIKDNLRIFLDIDSVMADWTKAACETCDIDYNDSEVRKKLKKQNRIEQLVPEEEAWGKIDKEGEKWWINLDLYPWSKRLHEELNKKTKMFSFLTSPSDNKNSLSGKSEWIKKHFDTTYFLMGKHKYFCATKNSLLIDDSEKKTKQFEEYGGNIFLWPNPVKLVDGDIDVDTTIKELLEYIDELKG